MELHDMKDGVECKFLRQNIQHKTSKLRYGLIGYLIVFQIIFIATFYIFGSYSLVGQGKYDGSYKDHDLVPKSYASKLTTVMLLSRHLRFFLFYSQCSKTFTL